MSLFNPWVILTLLCAFLGFGFQSYLMGEKSEQKRQQLEIAQLNAEARAKEQVLVSAIQTQATKLQKANQDAKLAKLKRDTDIDSGALKLRIPVKAPNCPISVSESTTPTSGDSGGETRAELSAEAGKTLFQIAEEGDKAIIKLNACIESYNQVRETLKGKP